MDIDVSQFGILHMKVHHMDDLPSIFREVVQKLKKLKLVIDCEADDEQWALALNSIKARCNRLTHIEVAFVEDPAPYVSTEGYAHFLGCSLI